MRAETLSSVGVRSIYEGLNNRKQHSSEILCTHLLVGVAINNK